MFLEWQIKVVSMGQPSKQPHLGEIWTLSSFFLKREGTQMHKVRMSFNLKGDVTRMANQGGKYGTALQAALIRRNLDIVKLLLERGGDPNAQGENVFSFQGRCHWNGKSSWQVWDSHPSSHIPWKSGHCHAAS
jgi:hypothetical protein